jgi:WD40 repeat protein
LTGQPLAARPDPATPIGAAIDPRGTRVLNVELRLRVAVWNLADGSNAFTLGGHTAMITDAEWSPDGAYIISGSLDGTARLWETGSGDAVGVIAAPRGANMVSFAPDGRRIAIARGDGRVGIYELPTYHGSPAELANLLACRVPYVVTNDRLVPRARRCRY